MDGNQQTVFVYGTLKPGGHYWPRFCEGKVSQTVPAKIRGSLFDLGVGYPGLMLNDFGWVHGFLLTLPHEADFFQLDVLEGYKADRAASQNDYIRLKVSRASGSPSLMDTDYTSFSAGANESNRQVRTRAKKPPSEKHKDDPSGLKCGKYMANSQKNCTANITKKGQQKCISKRCGHHCENKSECPVHRSSGKK